MSNLGITTRQFDRFGMGLSGLCVVHCVVTTVLLATLASAGGLLGSPLIHEVGLFIAMVIGAALIYLPGLAWLGTVIGWDKPVLTFGLYPFLAADALKVALGALLMPAAWKLLGR